MMNTRNADFLFTNNICVKFADLDCENGSNDEVESNSFYSFLPIERKVGYKILCKT